MASLRRFPGSPFWFACFTLPDGRRTQKSTKQSDRRRALAVAMAFEKAAKLGAEKRLGEAQARRVLSEIYETVNNAPLPSKTARVFLEEWAASRKIDTSLRTAAAYAQVARDFVGSLGPRADIDVSMLTKADVAKYRDAVRNRTSVATANKSLKYLRVALGAAYKDGLAQDNPAAKLDVLARTAEGQTERRAFTLEELKALYRVATGEWRGLILFGLYAAGPRLKDLALLTWANVDLETRELRFVTKKTGRRMRIPLRDVLERYLSEAPAPDDPSAPLFPQAHAIASKGGSDSRLSLQFHGLLEAAGLAEPRSKAATGRGRSLRRQVSELSFHSLRHTATTFLKSAGVAHIVAQDLVGHDSEAVSRRYSHVDDDAKRRAIDALPDIFK